MAYQAYISVNRWQCRVLSRCLFSVFIWYGVDGHPNDFRSWSFYWCFTVHLRSRSPFLGNSLRFSWQVLVTIHFRSNAIQCMIGLKIPYSICVLRKLTEGCPKKEDCSISTRALISTSPLGDCYVLLARCSHMKLFYHFRVTCNIPLRT